MRPRRRDRPGRGGPGRPERWAISAMVNWRASYIRWALSISVGVIFGLRPPVRPRTRAAASPAWVRSLMSAASYSAISANMPKTSLPFAWRCPRCRWSVTDPDVAGLQGGDDVDQVAQITAEPGDLPDDQGVAGAQVGQAGVPPRAVGFRAGRGVGVDLQAVGDGERVELELRVLVGGADACIAQVVCHRRTPPNPCCTGCCVVLTALRLL